MDYDGNMLLQGNDDFVEILLLKDKLESSQVVHSVMLDPKVVKAAISQPAPQSGPEHCFICSKQVYSTERIAPNSKVMHKTCFKCSNCSNKLNLNNYCLNNGIFTCKPCYETAFKAKGGNYN